MANARSTRTATRTFSSDVDMALVGRTGKTSRTCEFRISRFCRDRRDMNPRALLIAAAVCGAEGCKTLCAYAHGLRAAPIHSPYVERARLLRLAGISARILLGCHHPLP